MKKKQIQKWPLLHLKVFDQRLVMILDVFMVQIHWMLFQTCGLCSDHLYYASKRGLGVPPIRRFISFVKYQYNFIHYFIDYTLSESPSSTCRIDVSRKHQAPAPDLQPMIASGCAAAVVHARYSGPYLDIDLGPVYGRAQGHRSHRSLCCQEQVLSRRTGCRSWSVSRRTHVQLQHQANQV